MRRALVLLSCLAVAFSPGCAFHRSVSKSLAEKRSREKEARGAASQWLALVDAVSLRPWGSDFFRLVRDHSDVFTALPPHLHDGRMS